MIEALGLGEAELSVLLCDDERITALNRDYRDTDRPTDVLSFPMEDELGTGEPRLLGDLVISIPTAARQGGRGAGALRQEVTRLLAHGVLHLTGETHETSSKLRTMERETERLIDLVSLGRRPRTAE